MYVSVMAASSIANIVKSSLGPVGLDKMLVDDVGVGRLSIIILRPIFNFFRIERFHFQSQKGTQLFKLACIKCLYFLRLDMA